MYSGSNWQCDWNAHKSSAAYTSPAVNTSRASTTSFSTLSSPTYNSDIILNNYDDDKVKTLISPSEVEVNNLHQSEQL